MKVTWYKYTSTVNTDLLNSTMKKWTSKCFKAIRTEGFNNKSFILTSHHQMIVIVRVIVITIRTQNIATLNEPTSGNPSTIPPKIIQQTKQTKLCCSPKYCWWEKSCTNWQVVYPIIYKVLYIPGGWPWDFWSINSVCQRKNTSPTW